MALCKFLKGDSKRISTDITPFHEGWIYVTNDGYMYIDMNLGTKEEPNNQRVKLNAGDAETLFGASLSKIMNSSDGEIPTSKAVMDELKKYALASHTHNDVYYPKDEIDSKISTLNTKINKKSDTNHSHVIADVTNLQSSLDSKVPASRKINDKELTADIKLSASDVGAATSTHDHSGVYSPVGHNHNDKYYTETEVNTLLANKANTEDIPEKVSELTNDSGYITKSVSNLDNYYTETEIDARVNAINNSIAGKANATHEHSIDDVTGLQTALDNKADKSEGVLYIEGTGTTDTTNKVATWLGSHGDITEYFAGLTILYKVGTEGSTTTTLNINNLGAVKVVRNATTSISTAVPVDAVVLLTYTVDSDGIAYWKTADYDSNTKTTTGTSNKTGTKLYLAGATSQSSSGATTYSNKNVYIGTDNSLYSNGTKVSVEGHTHESVGKLDVSGGSEIQPIYFSNGIPVETKYALNKTVPADAVFTDTVYTHPSYTARTGVPTANQTPLFGDTFQVTQPVSDATGHITSMNSRTITIPELPIANGDTLGIVKSGGDVTITNGVITVNDDSHNHTIANVDNLQSTLDSKVPATRTVNGKALSANISLSASDVGADAFGTASNTVSTHNTNSSAHNDIRLLITNLTNRLDTVANSTDKDLDQLSEIVAYIKSNKELIDAITTSKVSVSDIINNLTTNVSNKPLSAAQGVALKKLIDEIVVPTKVSELTNDSGYLTEHPDITVFDHAEHYGSLPTSYGQIITILTNLTHDENGHVTSWTENNIMLPTVDGALSDTSTKPVQNKVVTAALNEKPDLWVGTKAEYDALGTTDENCFYAILDDYQDAGFENASNKVTAITSSSTDTQYPSAAAVYRTLQNISGYERTENRDNVISAGSTDNTYPSSLAVYTHTNNTVNSAKETILQTIEDRVYGVEKQSNKVIEITENAGHTTYPSAKAVYEAIQTYGGTDIETTNIIDENSTADEVPSAKAVHDFVVNHVPEIPDVSTMIPTVYTSTSEPTPSDGKVGDLWVVTD